MTQESRGTLSVSLGSREAFMKATKGSSLRIFFRIRMKSQKIITKSHVTKRSGSNERSAKIQITIWHWLQRSTYVIHLVEFDYLVEFIESSMDTSSRS